MKSNQPDIRFTDNNGSTKHSFTPSLSFPAHTIGRLIGNLAYPDQFYLLIRAL